MSPKPKCISVSNNFELLYDKSENIIKTISTLTPMKILKA